MEISLAAEKLLDLGPLPVTNTLLVSWIVTVGMIIGALVVRARLQTVPSGLQNFAEAAIEGLSDFFESVVGDKRLTAVFFPILATFFFFILISNWFGIFPGFGSIGIRELHEGKTVFVPILRSVHADINMTLALAIISVIATQLMGLKEQGFGYLKKFFNFSNPIMFGVGLLEIVSEFAKILSFSFRLFGNVFAGEVLLTIVGFIAAYLAPLPFYGLELFVGFIQALVFTMLTLVFFTIATSHQEH